MAITTDMHDEMNLLLQFPKDSLRNGLKIHHEASAASIRAAIRLHDKGLISQSDGGYLTDAGIELADKLSVIHSALS